ncbi:hypothetical protein XBKQ1_2910018 [Xenorhabdus bovienii str. kraussei Quebec]|uniref:Uncharacterized protein n=1 Tax=Xenorhabdus bovienii str. kraussei Quebec TaxID=1398203 RepID=A0A077PJF9_XENBV|nr:hypothetical protein XBKQ1_2910018 [Xenorhabdus bovienii str. kraussei Quebec]
MDNILYLNKNIYDYKYPIKYDINNAIKLKIFILHNYFIYLSIYLFIYLSIY